MPARLAREVGRRPSGIERAAIGDDVAVREIKAFWRLLDNAAMQYPPSSDLERYRIFRGAHTAASIPHLDPSEHGPVCRIDRFSGLPQKTVEWLLCREYEPARGLRMWLGGGKDCASRLQTATNELAALSGSAFWSGNADNPWGAARRSPNTHSKTAKSWRNGIIFSASESRAGKAASTNSQPSRRRARWSPGACAGISLRVLQHAGP